MNIKQFFQEHQSAALALAVLAGAVLGYVLPKYQPGHNPVSTVSITRQDKGKYQFVSPLLTVDVGDEKDFKEFKPFEKKLNDLLNTLKSGGQVTEAGLYFRDFNSGHWVGINEDEKFLPGSLLKVPLMMAYFKAAETNPGLLTQKLTYDGKGDANSIEYVKPAESLAAGQSYTIAELIRHMIVYSDNNAMVILYGNIDTNSLNEIYSDLGITLPVSINDLTDFLSPKQFSLFLRILRNSTYLSPDFSETALQLMTQVDFKNGLVAGVPNSIQVAHKFGEYRETDNNVVYNELHDCGIVYAPSHTYLLCVMTKGRNEPDLENSIKQISALVYGQVMNDYKN